KTLECYKNHLQTVVLVCEEEDRQEFEDIFFHTGVVRITNGENMSKSYCGIAHDGDFALRRYMKVVSCEY
ncbi:MAG: acyl-CoA reductase, partial [Christensenellaceae bacterium]